MRVDIDKSRRNDLAGGLDDLMGLCISEIPDVDNRVPLHRDIGAKSRSPGPVDYEPVTDENVKHLFFHLQVHTE